MSNCQTLIAQTRTRRLQSLSLSLPQSHPGAAVLAQTSQPFVLIHPGPAENEHRYGRACHDRGDGPSENALSFYRLPLAHHKHMKSTDMLERLNQEIKRRTLVVRIFPNPQSCLRLVRALAVEIHENWLEATRYLNMEHLREHKKESLRALAA
nr:transposase [Mesorhizobium tamadayense]